MSSIEEMAVNLRIKGFSDKLFEFAAAYIDIMLECARPGGFDEDQVLNSMEKKRSKYANNNIEVDSHAFNNRILLLIPHTFHDTHMEKVLRKELNDAQ